ncbi:MAG: GGDEF domain-containing protein [Thermoanaerobaculia bacterium]
MRTSFRSTRFWWLQLGLAAAWVGVWQWGRVLSQTPFASLWFPPAGLSFAMFLTMGPSAAVAVIAAAVVTTFENTSLYGPPSSWATQIVSGVAFGLAHSLAYWLGASLFNRLYGEERFGTPRAVLGFLVFATLAATLAAIAGITSIALTQPTSQISLQRDGIPWGIGDLVAVVTLAPLFVVLSDRAAILLGLQSSGWLEGLRRVGSPTTLFPVFGLKLLASAALALALAALGTLSGLYIPVALTVYVLLVPLTWIAHTEGAVRSVAAVAILAGVVAVAAAFFGTKEDAFNLQAGMIAIAGISLFNLTVPRLYADNQRLRDMVRFDPLTGAFSRPIFFEIAERERLRSRRAGAPLALVALDVDRFKEVNDQLGHAVGDRVLARVGSLCRGVLREGEVIGRIGGEEFAVLLPATDVDTAQNVAERLRLALEEADWSSIKGVEKITGSFGVVSIDPFEGSLRSAMDRADQAMYEAKRAGRNRVHTA